MDAGAGHGAFEKKMSDMGFDPTIIIAIIGALIPLITNCFKPTPQSSVSVPRLANAIRERDSTVGFIESRRQAKAAREVWDGSTVEERQAFIDDCCG